MTKTAEMVLMDFLAANPHIQCGDVVYGPGKVIADLTYVDDSYNEWMCVQHFFEVDGE